MEIKKKITGRKILNRNTYFAVIISLTLAETCQISKILLFYEEHTHTCSLVE